MGTLIFDDAEVLDVCAPFEVVASARPLGTTGDDQRSFRVVPSAATRRTIYCLGGLLVQNHTTADHIPIDILLLPGGYATLRAQLNDPLPD